ncbi:extracellular catalytic domain type 1 short-chain-length polyhydroxyalkanoate depolymerase [Microvirga makkahensis]|uniref:PHB depolymerase family esterase n=1 Tax=Microvirga makkahensis TaxID=1128670 RepID=A0A7X3SMD7_9HYPH|nr:PHB depolymerase family esterase [Microvirga makkahensis]MXQ10206.1 PHB depolymerase family esterase [Microvirga makkahensis]
MQRLGSMIHQLARYRSQWEGLMRAAATNEAPLEPLKTALQRLVETENFGVNPGNLRMFTYAPPELASSPGLVVVLHGCTQNAAGYDLGSGWSVLAERYGFVVLFPEQRETNNPKRCFNWFQTGDTERDRGEVASIREMVEIAIRKHGIDRDRVFVTGLSAGGAMTAAMLATYPEVFAGGAIIAGLPYRCATSVSEAFECMFQGQTRPAGEWGDLVRQASRHRGPWPKVSVWHGSADATVKPINAGEIIKQWTDVHGLSTSASRSETVDGYPRRVWVNDAGEDVIEEYIISGMAHGTPLATGNDENHYGVAGPFLIEVGISSSYHIAKFWGLTGSIVSQHKPSLRAESLADGQARTRQEDRRGRGKDVPSPIPNVGGVIVRALKAAGLMR